MKNKITSQEASAIEFCLYASKAQIEQAYSRASMHGEDKACEVYLNELDKVGA